MHMNGSVESCQAESVKDFEVYKSGGDGGVVQYCK